MSRKMLLAGAHNPDRSSALWNVKYGFEGDANGHGGFFGSYFKKSM